MRYYQEEGRQLGVFFSAGVRHTLERSLDQAMRFNHNFIGTEHLLLALVAAEPTDPAMQILQRLGVSVNKVRSEVVGQFELVK